MERKNKKRKLENFSETNECKNIKQTRFNISGEVVVVYNETLEEKQACKRAWASGIRTEYISIPSGQDSSMLVIYFKKGMAYPFFPLPMNQISDSVVDTNILWGQEFEELREQLLAEPRLDQRFQIAEEFLVNRFVRNAELNECVSYAVRQIVSKPDQTVLGSLYDEIGYSQKHFTDMFKKHVGVTPKSYLRVMRFQRAIGELESGNEINFSEVAFDAGFYDQAHFINDFRRFSGFTPKQYLERKNGTINYVPVK